MKKLILIIMALVTMQITAQEPKKEHQKSERQERFKDFTPEQIAALQTKKMALKLDLTESQQPEIEKIYLANAKEHQAKREELKLKREKNNGEKLSKEERFNFMNDRLDKQIFNKKEMKQILSKEQFEKFEKGMNNKRRKSQVQKQKNRSSKKQGSKIF